MPKKNISYTVGSTIEYQSTSGRRVVKVSERIPNIRRGEPGFIGTLVGQTPVLEVWGYDSDVIRLIEKA